MTAFRHTIELAASFEGPFLRVEGLIDPDATYTIVPRSVLAEIGVTPQEQRDFILPDGQTVSRDVAEVYVRIEDEVGPTICVVVDEGSEVRVGWITLGGLLLAVDPATGRLIRQPGYLLREGVEEGALRRAERDLALATEWFSLGDEGWRQD